MKLSSGWKKLSCCVFENNVGDRVHTGGLVKFKNGEILQANNSKYGRDFIYDSINIMGGNRKRGLMFAAERWVYL